MLRALIYLLFFYLFTNLLAAFCPHGEGISTWVRAVPRRVVKPYALLGRLVAGPSRTRLSLLVLAQMGIMPALV